MVITDEEWIKYNSHYFVSNLGRIKSVDSIRIFHNFNGTKIIRQHQGKLLATSDNGNGYKCVHLGRKKREYVHRLVAKLFLKNPRKLKYVNHKNGIKSDNRSINLEWVTASENQTHSKNFGLCKLGENHSQSKLSSADVEFIKSNYHLGTKVLATKFKVARPTICKIANNKARKHG